MTRKRSNILEYLEALLVAGIFLGFANTFVVKTFYIPSASMEESLLIGDHLFVNRFIFRPAASDLERALLPLRAVDRGDIVIFRSPETPSMDMVKRCIGLPGDVIEVVDKRLLINGQEVDDSAYALHRDPRILRRGSVRAVAANRDNYGPYTVPEDHYFCMGDNRDHSYDSRFWGPVPAYYVKGRAFLIYWSYGGEVSDGNWYGVAHWARQLAGTVVGFFTKTRWDRSFQIVR